MDAPALDAGTVGLPGDPRQAVVAVALDGDGDRFGRTDPGVVDDTPVHHTQGVERRLVRRCEVDHPFGGATGVCSRPSRGTARGM